MNETLIGSSIKDIGKNIQKLSRENKKLARYLKSIGTTSDTAEFRNNLRTEIHATTALVKSLLSSIQDLKQSEDSHNTSIKLQRLEQQFLDKYTKLSSLTKSIKTKLESTQPYQPNNKTNKIETNPFLSNQSEIGGYDLSHVKMNNESIEYENHPPIPKEEQEISLQQSQAFIPQFDSHLDELENREEAIHQMVDDLTELNSMYKDLHGLVYEQGEQIEVLSSNVEHAKDEVKSGVVHLDKAASHQRKYRKKMCIILMIIYIKWRKQVNIGIKNCIIKFLHQVQIYFEGGYLGCLEILM
eukprot:416439_1